MLKINKELLKELIKETIRYNFACTSSGECDFNYGTRDYITYTDTIKIVRGNSCWEDSQEEIVYTDAYYNNEKSIGDIINELVIQDNELLAYNIDTKNPDIMCKYYSNYISSHRYDMFIDTDVEQTEKDYYGNYTEKRIMIINIEKIVNYLLTFPFTKPVEEIQENLSVLSLKDIEKIKNTSFIRHSILNDELEVKDVKDFLKKV